MEAEAKKLNDKQERLAGRRTKIKIRHFKLDPKGGPANEQRQEVCTSRIGCILKSETSATALDATLPTVKEEQRPSKWAAQLVTSQLAVRKSLHSHIDELDRVIRRYTIEEDGAVKDQDSSRKVVKDNCDRSLAETRRAQSEQAKDWAELQGMTNPMALSVSMREEVEKATKVLDNSTDLASQILSILQERDELYAKTLKIGADRTDKMLQMLSRQADELHDKCAQEMELAEQAFLKDKSAEELRRKLELGARLEQQRVAEHQHCAKYVKALQEYEEQLASMKDAGNSEKDRELHDLKQHLETMKATYIYNEELLKYNERLLKERKPETQLTIIHQKRRIAEQREVLSKLKQRASVMERGRSEEHGKLAAEHSRRSAGIVHQLNKQATFHTKNDHTYHEVRRLKESMVKELTKKRADLSQTITSLILNVPMPDGKTHSIPPEVHSLSLEDAYFLLEQSLQEYHSLLSQTEAVSRPVSIDQRVHAITV